MSCKRDALDRLPTPHLVRNEAAATSPDDEPDALPLEREELLHERRRQRELDVSLCDVPGKPAVLLFRHLQLSQHLGQSLLQEAGQAHELHVETALLALSQSFPQALLRQESRRTSRPFGLEDAVSLGQAAEHVVQSVAPAVRDAVSHRRLHLGKSHRKSELPSGIGAQVGARAKVGARAQVGARATLWR
eukprot:scaffold1642_cov252-Pinguiococcus_pyrenoidosus.AAC.34